MSVRFVALLQGARVSFCDVRGVPLFFEAGDEALREVIPCLFTAGAGALLDLGEGNTRVALDGAVIGGCHLGQTRETRYRGC